MSIEPAAITDIRLTIADVTAATRWAFVEVLDGDGRVGTGEASLLRREAALEAAFPQLARGLVGRAATVAVLELVAIPPEMAAAAIRSAIDQALWDLDGQRAGRGLVDLIGRRRDGIAVYANINRRTRERSPAGFAASARAALAAGFTAVKLAPFDEVTPPTASLALAGAGLARIAAVRAALPAAAKVFVDCHWRFTPEVAAAMVPALAERGVAWYECPIAETDAAAPDLRKLRGLANARGMVLAGREEGVTRQAFAGYAKAGAYDVMMPDVKYVGGIAEMLATADMLAGHGIAMSPHNHTGPVAHAASLAVAGAAAGCQILEMQFDETEHFDGLVGGRMPKPAGGVLAMLAVSGLGVALDGDALARLTTRTLSAAGDARAQ